MKQVIYGRDKKYLLTDQEFVEAIKAWDEGNNYWCNRLEALLSKFITYAETPRFEVDSEIFILQGNGGSWQRVYLRNGIYYELVTLDSVQRLVAPPALQEKATIDRLVPQEEFFREKKYII